MKEKSKIMKSQNSKRKKWVYIFLPIFLFLTGLSLFFGLFFGLRNKQSSKKTLDEKVLVKEEEEIVEILSPLSQEVQRISDIPSKIINKTKPLGKAELTEKELDFAPNNDFTYTISHQAINQDGDYEVKINVSLGNENKEATRKIAVSGIDQNMLEEESKRIENLLPVTISKTKPLGKAELTEKELDFALNNDFTYAISHQAINQDGDYGVKINVSFGNENKDATRKIAVSGIDQNMVDQEVIRIENLLPVTINKENPLGKAELTEKELDFAPNNDFTYTISHQAINQDGDYGVKINVSFGNENKEATRKIAVSGIDQNMVDQEVIRIENLLPVTINKVNPLGNVEITEEELDFAPNNDFGYTIIYDAINQDGDYEIAIIVILNGKVETARRKVLVEGISAYRVLEEVQRISDMPRKKISKTNPIPQNNLKERDLDFAPNNDFTYTISHQAINQDGDYEVKINVSLGNENKEATRKIAVSGIDQNMLEEEAKRIENLLPVTISKTKPLDQDELTEKELDFAPNNDFTYTISHQAINRDGDYEIVITISLNLNGKSIDTQRSVKISGIPDQKKKELIEKANSIQPPKEKEAIPGTDLFVNGDAKKNFEAKLEEFNQKKGEISNNKTIKELEEIIKNLRDFVNEMIVLNELVKESNAEFRNLSVDLAKTWTEFWVEEVFGNSLTQSEKNQIVNGIQWGQKDANGNIPGIIAKSTFSNLGDKLPDDFQLPEGIVEITGPIFNNTIVPKDFIIPEGIIIGQNVSPFSHATLQVGFKVPGYITPTWRTFSGAVLPSGSSWSSSHTENGPLSTTFDVPDPGAVLEVND